MKRHDTMRGWFAYELYQQMKKNKNIWLVTGDLGYKMFDSIKDDFPDRFLNAGSSEQAMMGIAVGLALKGKIPFVYSITPFLLYRSFETIRNYINQGDTTETALNFNSMVSSDIETVNIGGLS